MYAPIIGNPPCIVFDLRHCVFATDGPSSGREEKGSRSKVVKERAPPHRLPVEGRKKLTLVTGLRLGGRRVFLGVSPYYAGSQYRRLNHLRQFPGWELTTFYVEAKPRSLRVVPAFGHRHVNDNRNF